MTRKRFIEIPRRNKEETCRENPEHVSTILDRVMSDIYRRAWENGNLPPALQFPPPDDRTASN